MIETRRFPIAILIVLFVFCVVFALAAPSARAQYELVPQQTPIRWNFWLSDGPAEVLSSDNSLGNRFQVGAEGHFGADYRWLLGVTLIDWLTSGETSPGVGDISRYGFDLRVGYFVVPDKLFLEYGLYLGEIEGSQIWGWNTTIGHEVGVGWRFYSQDQFNLTVEANYLFIGSQNTTGFNPVSGNFENVSYPRANVYGLNIRVGFDWGGR